jgi:AraC-like DNA-binding protein
VGTIFTIPQDLFTGENCLAPGERTAIRVYDSPVPSVKSRVTMQKNLFSFLLEGEKVVHRPREPLHIYPGQFLLIAGGNCLMTEKLSVNNRYHSLLFFFDDSVLKEFFLKYPGAGGGITGRRGEEPLVCFEGDAFIRNYLYSLQLLVQAHPFLPEELHVLKLEELLFYLATRYPEILFSFRLSEQTDVGDRQLQSAVEGNLHQAVTVEELAFVCNMSLSTFKRRFARLYGTSPNKWLLQKRMERAATLLQEHAKPSEVYHQVGYENHSSFTQSFKQVYGMTPKEFQQGAAARVGMNV